MKDEFKRVSNRNFGPGGYKCQCCGPLPKEKPSFRRKTRRVLKQEDIKLTKEENVR
jgi:hypothetical protein